MTGTRGIGSNLVTQFHSMGTDARAEAVDETTHQGSMRRFADTVIANY